MILIFGLISGPDFGSSWLPCVLAVSLFTALSALWHLNGFLNARRKRLRNGTGIIIIAAAPIMATPTRINDLAAIGASVILVLALTNASSFTSGYYYRGDQENRQRWTYPDVLILARYDAKNYDVRPADMEKWNAGLCEDNDWQPWQKLKRFSFKVQKQANGEICLDAFEGGYEFYTKDGKRILYPQEIADGR